MNRPTFLLTCFICLVSLPAIGADLPAHADTWVDGAAAVRDANFNNSSTLRARRSGPRFALVRFDTARLPTGRATLLLRVHTVNAAGSVQVRLITSAWTTSSVTFNTRPTLAAAPITSRNVTAADAGKTLSFEVTDAVSGWRSTPSTNFGLAITATGSTADVYFASREGGTAPVLRAVVPAADNDVTVRKSGGDYADPILAANNALMGDRWCVSPTSAAPCIIRIGAGIFPLSQTLFIPGGVVVVGHDKRQTVLAARRGIDRAVRVNGPGIRSLTIINDQPELSDTIALERQGGASSLSLENVVAFAAAGTNATAFRVDSFHSGTLVVTDSELRVKGGSGQGVAIAMSLSNSSVQTTIARSRLSASGPRFNLLNSGLHWESQTGVGDTHLLDTIITLSGGSVRGVFVDADRVRLTMDRVTVIGDARGGATGVAGPGNNTTVLMTGGRMNLTGSSTTGVHIPLSGAEPLIDGVSIDAHSDGVAVILAPGFPSSLPFRPRILRSQIVGLRFGLMSTAASPITVEQSFLKAVRPFTGFGPGSVEFESSVVMGPMAIDATVPASCIETYDERARLRSPTCEPLP